jgi:hypothetical protein
MLMSFGMFRQYASPNRIYCALLTDQGRRLAFTESAIAPIARSTGSK